MSVDVSVTDSDLERYGQGFLGELLRPGDQNYEACRPVWNAMIDAHPALIARPRGVADVQAAIALARATGLQLAVRGGGHSAAGKGTCDGIVIDLSLMKAARVDPQRQTVRIQGGATWREFDRESQTAGLATPGGLFSTTGVGGLTLGGGLGWLSRRFGPSCDNVISMDVVTADGEQLVCSAEENPDLFWALRGGGGNFGVVTSFEFQCHPVGPLVLGGFIGWDAENAGDLMRLFGDIGPDLPDEFGISVGYFVCPPLPYAPESLHNRPVVTLIFCWSGDLDEGREALKPFLDLAPDFQVVNAHSYTYQQEMQDELGPPGRFSYWKTGYLTELSDELIELVTDRFRSVPSPYSMIEFPLLGGQYDRRDESQTAFTHYGGKFAFNMVSYWDDADGALDRNVEWLRDVYDAATPHAIENAGYVNWMTDDEIERAYDGEKYARLASIKATYDPDNLFRTNQNISPARPRSLA